MNFIGYLGVVGKWTAVITSISRYGNRLYFEDLYNGILITTSKSSSLMAYQFFLI
jgi:hypothetical protein